MSGPVGGREELVADDAAGGDDEQAEDRRRVCRPRRPLRQPLEERQADGDRAGAAQERAPVDRAKAGESSCASRSTGRLRRALHGVPPTRVRNALFLTRSMIICLTEPLAAMLVDVSAVSSGMSRRRRRAAARSWPASSRSRCASAASRQDLHQLGGVR